MKRARLIADDEPHLAENLRDGCRAVARARDAAARRQRHRGAARRSTRTSPTSPSSTSACPASPASSSRAHRHATHIVFVTAFDQYAVEAFDREVVDYL
jgi:DNA-binding LytR/AlgR family response regulator